MSQQSIPTKLNDQTVHLSFVGGDGSFGSPHSALSTIGYTDNATKTALTPVTTATPLPVQIIQVATAPTEQESTITAVNGTTTAITMGERDSFDIIVEVQGSFPLLNINSLTFELQRKSTANSPFTAFGAPAVVDTTNALNRRTVGWSMTFPFNAIRVICSGKDGSGTTFTANTYVRVFKLLGGT